MPFYEFECSCGNVTEELVKMGTEEVACPKCGNTARKIMSPCAFSLKGGGWYADGYASKGGSTSSGGSGTAKTESKADTGAKSPDSGASKSSGSDT